MQILQLDLHNKKQVDDFLQLPFSIYRSISRWVPPLQMDERLRLSPGRFPFYEHSQAAFFLAYERSTLPRGRGDEGMRPIGRLAVLENRRYNEYNKTKTASGMKTCSAKWRILGLRFTRSTGLI